MLDMTQIKMPLTFRYEFYDFNDTISGLLSEEVLAPEPEANRCAINVFLSKHHCHLNRFLMHCATFRN
jgi:hypothetical protein